MDDLRRTAMAYYEAAPDEIKRAVKAFNEEMDPKHTKHVRFEQFSEHMKKIGCGDMASNDFFKKLKQPKKEVLGFEDVVTLYYIIHSGRPFCGGSCKKFVEGMYFTCVKCFFGSGNTTFSVCSKCFSEKQYQHRHNVFLDPMVLLRNYKTMEAWSKQEKKSSTNATGKPKASSSAITIRRHETKIEASSSASKISKDETKKVSSSTNTSQGKRSSTNAAGKQELVQGTKSSTKAVGKPEASSSASTMSKDKTKKDAHSSSSNAVVPFVNQRSRQADIRTAILVAELLANVGGLLAAAATTCTIL